jgi:nickel-dependent lactate racemase
MIYFEKGARNYSFGHDEVKKALFEAFDKLGERKQVLVIPPDITRFHSRAGELTQYAYEYYGKRLTTILPALGTHTPMTDEEIERMFPGIPKSLFRVHNFRYGIVTVGFVDPTTIEEITEGKFDFEIPLQVNTLLTFGAFDLILSLGQVVPHEVIGMAGYNKNIFVGVGGEECIGKSHFIGATYGMERIMGRTETPVREVMNYGCRHFIYDMPLVYLQTVISEKEEGEDVAEDGLQMRGLYIGDDSECFEKAAALSLEANFRMLDREMHKVVVYLDPEEFRSTWLGNKSIYRTRMAIADGGQLIVLAPGLRQFGEDQDNDALIRKYGYVNTPQVMKYVSENEDLKNSLGVAAHLIHGSSEGRFGITYCPGHLTREEIESVGFEYASLDGMLQIYDPAQLKDGWNMVNGEEIYYISNPALGLWAYRERFK